jgi:hypothetical protein
VLVHVDGEESEQALLDYAAGVIRENLQEWADKSGMAVDVAVRVAEAPSRHRWWPWLLLALLTGVGWALSSG